MSRPTTVQIDLSALRHNFQRVRAAAPNCRIATAVKANGYGHGLVRVAQALPADAFAVACLEEAITLRDAGVTQPIWLLEGVFDPPELSLCVHRNISVVVHHLEQVKMLAQTQLDLDRPVRVWLKIDTGMHRLGFAPEMVTAVVDRLRGCPSVMPHIGFMSHLARADERDCGFTLQQQQRFETTTAGLPGERSLANSAGILHWPQTHYDWVRPGIMLYGASPFVGGTAVDENLQPVMTLRTQLIAIHRFQKGAPVGYGGAWVCPEEMHVGVAAIGYGDGYPRHAPSGTPVLVNGQEAALIGRVSMDMITIDLRAHPHARVGDPVILWGKGLPAERVAAAVGTITYDLFCAVTSRVKVEVYDTD